VDDQPDIEIGAFVKAKRLRFHKKPEADVRVEGQGGSGSEGKTFRRASSPA
jgi:hypothetical protein